MISASSGTAALLPAVTLRILCYPSRSFANRSHTPQCYTFRVYAQKLRVEIVMNGERRPCPLDWLDSFCMRNFTGQAEFDDTLPIAEGLLEAGFRV